MSLQLNQNKWSVVQQKYVNFTSASHSKTEIELKMKNTATYISLSLLKKKPA